MQTIATFQVAEFGRKNKKVIFILGGWKTKQWLYVIPATLLKLNGYRCIVYTYDPSVLSPNVDQTRESMISIRDAILAKIAEMKEQGGKDFSLFGFSLGAVLACMVADKDREISKVILNTVGASFAASVWSWDDRMPGFKRSLQSQGYTLEKLERSWHDLAPVHNLGNLGDAKLLIYIARQDKVIPYDQGKRFVAAVRNKELSHQLIVNKWGSHAVAGMLNFLRFHKNLTFLQRR